MVAYLEKSARLARRQWIADLHTVGTILTAMVQGLSKITRDHPDFSLTNVKDGLAQISNHLKFAQEQLSREILDRTIASLPQIIAPTGAAWFGATIADVLDLSVIWKVIIVLIAIFLASLLMVKFIPSLYSIVLHQRSIKLANLAENPPKIIVRRLTSKNKALSALERTKETLYNSQLLVNKVVESYFSKYRYSTVTASGPTGLIWLRERDPLLDLIMYIDERLCQTLTLLNEITQEVDREEEASGSSRAEHL